MCFWKKAPGQMKKKIKLFLSVCVCSFVTVWMSNDLISTQSLVTVKIWKNPILFKYLKIIYLWEKNNSKSWSKSSHTLEANADFSVCLLNVFELFIKSNLRAHCCSLKTFWWSQLKHTTKNNNIIIEYLNTYAVAKFFFFIHACCWCGTCVCAAAAAVLNKSSDMPHSFFTNSLWLMAIYIEKNYYAVFFYHE